MSPSARSTAGPSTSFERVALSFEHKKKALTAHSSQLTAPSCRSGLTLVELLLFIGLLALASGAVVGFLVLTSENRARQNTAASVEQNGLQMLQFLLNEIRHAERIIDPPAASSGSLLTLQMSADTTNPVILAAQSGVMLLVRRDIEHSLTPSQVAVTHFRVWNTSPRPDRPSVSLSFDLTGVVPLGRSGAYTRAFRAAAALFPDAYPDGASCGCAMPQCVNGRYQWFICNAGACGAMTGSLLCH